MCSDGRSQAVANRPEAVIERLLNRADSLILQAALNTTPASVRQWHKAMLCVSVK